ncbi:MAG: T9SS type A sorting domain-containing protein [Flavihumibacter sp.]|nr:T9SS type A sorting domain-containing protein [Flavihumibacter sp.]
MKNLVTLFFIVIVATAVKAQVSFTANTPGSVPVYSNHFLYGTNTGYYPTWTDNTIANIAAGNVALGVRGAGAKTLRPSLPESFLETWGYNIRVAEFQHYASLGIQDNTVFLGLPASAAHKDNASYGGCADASNLFSNMYEPIWDGGANGTPVNENNYYALYVYKTVSIYKDYVKFWEILNEPDLDNGVNGWKASGQAGNWWDNDPTPCELVNIKAPVEHYVRLLRISYEVIKTVDPTAYVTTGGIGYPAFLDAILRNTDNPVDGSVNATYPLTGGAYFDCLSFHKYPLYDLQYWDNGIGAVAYKRHSDAAAEAFINQRTEMQAVLNTHGYNGSTYPQKVFICTETNLPRKQFGNFIGGDESQRNYYAKILVEAQKNNILQIYAYAIGEGAVYSVATDPYQTMGFYKALSGIGPDANGGAYLQEYTDEGIVNKTCSDILYGYRYDAARTAAMNLPATIGGGAFKNAVDDYVYVLWAKTATDQSEVATATYSFPAAMMVAPQLDKREWNFSQTLSTSNTASNTVALTGSPIYLSQQFSLVNIDKKDSINNPAQYQFAYSVYPNPAVTSINVRLELKQRQQLSLKLFAATGQLAAVIAPAKNYEKGVNTVQYTIPAALSSGVYYLQLEGGQKQLVKKIMITH